MECRHDYNYARIARAIDYITLNRHKQPNLDTVAAAVNMSPAHFQRMFKEWAGVSPKRFLQYLNVEYAKKILRDTKLSLCDVAQRVGLSGSGRLHDLFVTIEGMTPGEYKNGGSSLQINYNFAPTPFGDILVASTHRGICSIEFADDHAEALDSLFRRFPNAVYRQQTDTVQQNIMHVFNSDGGRLDTIRLHLRGTAFQLKVWEALLKIPAGRMTTYGDIAAQVGNCKACRAVGTAVGANPVAYIIPCHRVICASGEIGNYHWSKTRKNAILGWEAARL